MRSATKKALITLTSLPRLLAMPIISLGALLSLELALLKAKRKKQYLIPPIARLSNHGVASITVSSLPKNSNGVTWYYLILAELGEQSTWGLQLTILMRAVPNSSAPSKVTLATSHKPMGNLSHERIVQFQSFELL